MWANLFLGGEKYIQERIDNEDLVYEDKSR